MEPIARWDMHPRTAALAREVEKRGRDWDAQGNTRRLWDGDAALWTSADEPRWLGWMHIASEQLANLQPLEQLQRDVESAGFEHALVLGMGGSSLCPEVLSETFRDQPGFPRLHVLDSTDPAQVRAFDAAADPRHTLYIVASKSGTTLEPNIFKAYFFDRARSVLGDAAGSHFIAVTDPGSQLEKEAAANGFRAVYHGVKSIGGRYSALSNFGMVPAAIQGLALRGFLEDAARMEEACGPDVAWAGNPGVRLGIVLGTLAHQGRDKVTLVMSPGIGDLGAWLEQLLAESTGKRGRGLVPVDRERPGPPEAYGDDRIFASVQLAGATDPHQDAAVEALERAGQPVVRLVLPSTQALGAAFLQWEVATAVAGSILGINPFDQPDVEASKVETRALTDAFERSGALPEETPIREDGGVRLFADPANAAALAGARGLEGILRAHLGRARDGDYAALLAYVQMSRRNEEILQSIRHRIRDARGIATCLGFGPRFLHSTGQIYKGGPNSGVFLQITCDDAHDVPVPGQRYSFGVVKAAQARGDFQVLAARERRALRVHVGPDVEAGLLRIDAAVAAALGA